MEGHLLPVDISDSDNTSITLDSVLDLPASGPLAVELQSRRGSELKIDASKVERIGAQCFQVLISAVASWSEDEQPLSVVEPSQEFSDAMSITGIQFPINEECEECA